MREQEKKEWMDFSLNTTEKTEVREWQFKRMDLVGQEQEFRVRVSALAQGGRRMYEFESE